jgi:hypothetical protein
MYVEKSMSITIRLLDSISTIEAKINSSLSSVINDRLSSNVRKINTATRNYVTSSILESPEINALSSKDPTSLAGQFGFNINPSSIISAIVSSIVSSTEIQFVPYNTRLQGGGLKIYCQPSNFVNLLALPQGHTLYPGGDLHWLNWMLTKGDTIIVVNYSYNPQTGLGRSKLGNMKEGGFFRVPPQYSGNITDNFVTRALSNPKLDKQITDLISEILNG